jgi:hypothetical protein
MSKFIDKLNRLTKGEPQSIGFRRQQSAALKPKIQLVASLTRENAESLSGKLSGADAGLLRISGPGTGADSLQTLSEKLPDVPWGWWLQGEGGEIKNITKTSCDFILFSASSTPLSIIENTEVGKILEIEPSLGDGLLRATNELPVDAVLAAGEQKQGKNLTWQDLMLFQRVANLLTKHLLVSVPAEITESELLALWEAGVIGVVLEVGDEKTLDGLQKLRQLIDKTDFPLAGRRGRSEALLPHAISEQGEPQTEI